MADSTSTDESASQPPTKEAQNSAETNTLLQDVDRPRLPPAAGKGRVKGRANNLTVDVRNAIGLFIEHNIEGAQALYDRVAAKSPARALMLLAKFAGLVLPRQSQHAGTPLVQVNVGTTPISTAEGALEAYRLLIADPTFDAATLQWAAPVSTVELAKNSEPSRDDSKAAP